MNDYPQRRAPVDEVRRSGRHRRPVSFEAKRGEITALIGPNGAGKTTVFNCITGFYKPSEGMITLTRQRRSEVPARAAARTSEIPAQGAKVARTFQNIRLFSGMTVLENLLVAQHNKLMKGLGLHRARPARHRRLCQGVGRVHRAGPALAGKGRPDQTAPTIRPAIFPMARSGASRSRAPCARSRNCSASTSRRPASIRANRWRSTTLLNDIKE
jgi:ABC-type Fe3+/spermidine/putrescine transport system ATPase subunit